MAHGLPAVYSRCDAITGSDTVLQHFGGLICLATGNVAFQPLNSTAVITITGVAAGVVIPIETQLVKATGTTGSWGGLA